MEKYMVIYNPSSGKELSAQKIFAITRRIQSIKNIEVTFFATKKKNDATTAALRACKNNYDLIIACGGDGTVNEIVNGIMLSENKTKLAILPTGTINDFAQQLSVPKNVINYTRMLLNGRYKKIDIGKANDKYFVNVVGGGAFTNIPHIVPSDVKTSFGKYAYYLQGAFEIPGQLDKSYVITYTLDGKELTLNTFLFLISNTASVGGFRYLSPKATYTDGLLDIIIIEKSSPTDLLQIFTGILNGQHVNHNKVHYFQSKNVKISSKTPITLDIDGEIGDSTPVSINLINKAIDILVP